MVTATPRGPDPTRSVSGVRSGHTGARVSTRPLWADALPEATDGDVTMDRADVVVIGLGAAGLRAATSAARRGAQVVALDRGAPGGGASGRNGGFLLAGAADFHHVMADRIGPHRATALYRRTLVALDEEVTLAPAAVQRTGSFRVAVDTGEAVDCRAMAAAMRRDGLPVEEAEGPWGAGLWFAADAAMHPGERIAALVAAAAAADVTMVGHCAVTGVRPDDGGVTVATVRGTLHAGHVLVAVDGGVEELLPTLRGTVRTARAQMLASGPGAVSAAVVPGPMYARHGYDYWQRRPDGVLALGGGRDVGGAGEWTTADAVTPEVQDHLEVRALKLGVTGPFPHRWSGLLGFSHDRLPVCRLLHPRLAVATGYCGTGNVLGPVTAGAALGLLLDGAHPDAELLAGG